MSGLTPEEFYDRYALAWGEFHNKKITHVAKSKEPIATYSKAPTASSTEELYTALADFGHHSYGVALEPLESEYIHSKSVLFYYHKLRELDSTEFKQMTAELQLKEKLIANEKDARCDEERRLEQLAGAQTTVNFFTQGR